MELTYFDIRDQWPYATETQLLALAQSIIDNVQGAKRPAHTCQYCSESFDNGGAKMRHEQNEHC